MEMTIASAPDYSVTNPLILIETALVLLVSLPVKVPHPDASGSGAGVAEIPQPPTIVSPI